MSQQGTFVFGEQAAVATTYAVGTNRITLSQKVRTVRVICKGTGGMVFMVPLGSPGTVGTAATDLANPLVRFKMSSSDPTKSSSMEFVFVLPYATDTFDFLAVTNAAEVYLTGDTVPSDDC